MPQCSSPCRPPVSQRSTSRGRPCRHRSPGRAGRARTPTSSFPSRGRRECLDVLADHGWVLETRFENSSAFEHSANLHHETWGYLDLHRIMPGFGIDPDVAFEILWRDHETAEIAGVPCAVPTLPGQILVVLLHAGRSRLEGRAARDVEYAWSTADTATKESVRRLVTELDARTRVRRGLRTAGRAPRRPGVPAVARSIDRRGPREPRNGRPGSAPLRRGRNACGSPCGRPSSTSTISPRSEAASPVASTWSSSSSLARSGVCVRSGRQVCPAVGAVGHDHARPEPASCSGQRRSDPVDPEF